MNSYHYFGGGGPLGVFMFLCIPVQTLMRALITLLVIGPPNYSEDFLQPPLNILIPLWPPWGIHWFRGVDLEAGGVLDTFITFFLQICGQNELCIEYYKSHISGYLEANTQPFRQMPSFGKYWFKLVKLSKDIIGLPFVVSPHKLMI